MAESPVKERKQARVLINVKDKQLGILKNEKWRLELQNLLTVKNTNENSEKIEIISINSDDEEEIHEVPYDSYFRLIDKCINSPEFGENANIITMEDKMKDVSPYNIFFNTLELCPETKEQPNSIFFTDLLCPSLGKLKCSLQATCKADIEWILVQFAKRNLHKKPMTLIYGDVVNQWPQKDTLQELYPDIDCHYISVRKNGEKLGWHNTRLSIFMYEDDSLRVVIGSPNLCKSDWSQFNQAVWVSPACPKLPEGSSVLSGESPTGFKLALWDYLNYYKECEEYTFPNIEQWINAVENADFSEVKVALIFTVPGVHYPRKNGSFVHFLGHLLSRDCTIPAPKKEHDSWPIVAQTAAMGLIGLTPEDWLTTHVLKSLGSHKDAPYLATLWYKCKAQFCLIFPTVLNVLNGYHRPVNPKCANYEYDIKKEQPWLLKYLYQWKANDTIRSGAVSMSKCACRISPCWKKLAYFFLSGANLSRSAWGKMPNRDSGIYVRSFEMGVLFLPKYFEEEYFEVKDTPDRKNKRLFPLIFDVPLIPYGPEDDSFCFDELVEKGILSSDGDVISEAGQSSDKKNNNPIIDVKLKEQSESVFDSEVCSGVTKMTLDNEGKCHSNNNKDKDAHTPKKDLSLSVAKPNNLFFPTFKKS